MTMCKFRQDACDAYCNIAKQHDFCKDEENCPVFKLQEENERMKGILLRNDETIKTLNDIKNQKCIEIEKLKKNALVWHKVTCFDKPDENDCVTNDNPSELGKQYLIRLKRGDFVIQELTEACDYGFVLEDYEWEDVDAWAELSRV